MPTAALSADYDLHGVVGVRLLDAEPGDVKAVSRQLGSPVQALDRTPDILIRFVSDIEIPEMQLLGLDQWGFTPEGFFVLRSKKAATKVKIDFARLGGKCEIVCRTGLPSVPLLMAIVNLTAFAKGYVPLHASAFTYRERGILVAGWAKGGKTEALLSFGRHGARYVGDEWILIGADGDEMLGIPENIRLWDWHLDYLPDLNGAVSRERRWLFRGIHWAGSIERKASSVGLGNLLPVRYLRRAMPALRRQLNVTVAPQAIFGEPLGPCRARPERVFLMVSHDDPRIDIQPIEPVRVAERMAFSVQYEQLPIWEAYLAYRFAFPQAANPILDRLHDGQRSRLSSALQGKKAFVVRHPYRCPFPDLYQAMKPFC